MRLSPDAESLREAVRAKYAEQALVVTQAAGSACCGDPLCGVPDPGIYSAEEASLVPSEAMAASLGCGNPTALASLAPGDVVLDLGSGGGIDVLLAAGRVGPSGFVYGLDMTDEMLALAEENRRKQGATNVSFLKGHIEAIPLPEHAVDVIISNCVVNLSVDKGQVLREAFRVLRPGGRLAISDVVVQGALAPAVRQSLEAWVGCVAGALAEEEYRRLLADAGFRDVHIEVTHVYTTGDLAGPAACCGVGVGVGEPNDPSMEGRVVSAFVRAAKPRDAQPASRVEQLVAQLVRPSGRSATG